ncbi:hypothetical protein B0O80DRAFT_471983 [Mortierella sp. GBAus27b]|nr:hypothetical protein BGX31_000640 [Mortierella sp. GBA43]KAI8345742.1 hypothetical protein B0O80DRAFT_471983 [Mortierella sp. GBAus27b]
MLTKSFLVSSLLAGLVSVVAAAPKPVAPTTTVKLAPTASPAPKGKAAAIESADRFCIFLPPQPGGGIAEHEDDATAFCTVANVNGATGAQVLPRGFIQTAHFTENKSKKWVQVTGRMDGKKYSLSKSDEGGQYDTKAPLGASCFGYNYFVELVEPDSDIYCIRCCVNKADCPVNKSTYGCEKVLGGDYS